MFSLTEEKIYRLYDKYRNKAIRAFDKGRYDTCMRYLTATATTAYSFYLGYKDGKLEKLLQALSSQLKKQTDTTSALSNKVVFYDSFSADNGGLVQQYLGALIYCHYDILYIAERSVVLCEGSAIGKMLREYGKAEMVVIPYKKEPMANSQFIYDTIMESGASKLFVHTTPTAAPACCAFYALPPSITKYKINLTDHTFWIGTGFIDYSFEFRPYGGQLSTHERGVAVSHVLHLPFYPIMNHVGFEGFPKETENKVVLFSGGAYYKIFDKEDTFFKLAKAILDTCPNVIMIYAGFGDRNFLKTKLNEYSLEGRFILIGERKDITEVFEHCDIYLNTYPVGGGLMSQYAAQLGKPLLNYFTSGTTLVEEVVCQLKQITISDTSIDALVQRVKHLSENVDYRVSYGNEIKSCVITPERFNLLFERCMKEGTTPVPYEEIEPFEAKELDIQNKLVFENQNKGFQLGFVKTIGIAALWECPVFAIHAIEKILKENRLLKALKNRL